MPPELPDIEAYASLMGALSTPGYRLSLAAALPAFLDARRWFADRSAGAFEVRIEEAVPLSVDGALVLAIVRVETATSIARYQVPLLASPSGGVVDALDSAAGARALLDALSHPAADERLTVILTGSQTFGGAARVLQGEQSNTSVVFGDACILKLFRRLAEGRNPDVALTAWLSGPAGFDGVPETLAWARLDFGEWSADSLVVQAFVTNDGDGWQWALARARSAGEAAGEGAPFATWLESLEGHGLVLGAASLGQVTARLHAALASADEDGLRPSPFTREDWDVLTAGIRRDIDAAVATATGLHAGAAGVLRRLHRCIPEPPADFGWKTRIHGDYHLGQVLHTPRGWVIVDFEGEPARPLSERVALQHPLADVAGMIRSWDYAGATAAGAARDDWAAAATFAFLDAYRTSAAGAAFLPRTRPAENAVLRLFILRKALYELRYELDSRPAWAAIPLGALERIAMEAQ